MQVDLTLREAQVIQTLVAHRIENLMVVNDANYPTRQDDLELLNKLRTAADPHWNK